MKYPLLTFVFLILLTLKLAGIGVVATWSWWWVTAPLWGGVVFGLSAALVTLVAMLIAMIFRK